MLFTLSSSLLKKFPYQTKELLRIERIRQQKQLAEYINDVLIPKIGKYILFCGGLVMLLIFVSRMR